MAKVFKTLLPDQRTTLRTRLIAHGKIKEGSEKAKVSRWTIYNAIKGKPLSVKTYNKLLPLFL